jgi:hypothetical protein
MSSVQERIDVIRRFPDEIEQLTARLTNQQLTTAYNAPEWTIAQNVHHVADSHMSGMIRFRRTLTEDNPTVKPYDQDDWAKLPDCTNHEISSSLSIIRGLHARWVILLNNVSDWSRPLHHPTNPNAKTLDDLLTIYSNHCTAHLKQIQDVIAKI